MNSAGKNKQPFLFIVDFEVEHGYFVPDPIYSNDFKFKINKITNIENIENCIAPEVPDVYTFKLFAEEYDVYKSRFGKVIDGINNGESSLTNLTISTPIETSLSLQQIFNYSSSAYKIFVPKKFVCFSPECFVKIKDGKIVTFPMKGTINADVPDALNVILNDDKEYEEHKDIVDLMLLDLSLVSRSTKVNRFRYIDKIKTNKGSLLQVSSEVEGILHSDYMEHLGSIIFKLLPAGSVSGSPKKSTLNIITDAEESKRGFYTGIAGYFDGNNLDSFVLIRFIEQNENGLVFRSGGGITNKSICSKEYEEALQKVYLPF